MIQRVVDTLPDGRLILCHSPEVIPVLNRPFVSVPVAERTEGAACTVLLAAEHIDNDEPLLIANCDQLVWWDAEAFTLIPYANGAVAVFAEPTRNPKWSYVACGDGGWISRVAEKDPISDIATCGIYWWKRGRDFVTFAKAMIADDERVNGEFYVAPVYNRAIDCGWNIAAYGVERMLGMGTPDDLRATAKVCDW